MGSSRFWLKAADVESKSIPHEFPRSHWLKATGQCVMERYLSATMGLMRHFWHQIFWKNYNVLFCLAHTHIIKAICYNYIIYPQTFILIYSVAMETSTIIVKVLFFQYFTHFTAFVGALN